VETRDIPITFVLTLMLMSCVRVSVEVFGSTSDAGEVCALEEFAFGERNMVECQFHQGLLLLPI
jgi:hypothetical protein